MYRLLAILMLVIVAAGCAGMLYGTKYEYSFRLQNQTTSNMRFTDDMIDITFLVSDKAVNFDLKNKTDQTMKLIWDESVIVLWGESEPVMHKGVKFIDRDKSQTPSIIPKGGSISDLMIPKSKVYYVSGKYGGWDQHDLLGTQDFNKEDIKQLILSRKGKTFDVYIPIEIGDSKKSYTFTFEITDVQPATPS